MRSCQIVNEIVVASIDLADGMTTFRWKRSSLCKPESWRFHLDDTYVQIWKEQKKFQPQPNVVCSSPQVEKLMMFKSVAIVKNVAMK